MQTVMVYSEAGGVAKTTTAVSLAMVSAMAGKRVVLVDLDPRGATTQWLNVDPVLDEETGEPLHVGAILDSEDDTTGTAGSIAVQSKWNPNLRVIPADRNLSNREGSALGEYADLRLKKALTGLDADLVVLDCANRQAGILSRSAMAASTDVIYAARPTVDGAQGFYGAQTSIRKWKKYREDLGAPSTLNELGIILSGIEVIPTRITKAIIEELEGEGLLYPIVPERTIVREVRMTNEFMNAYRKGDPVVRAYQELAEKVIR